MDYLKVSGKSAIVTGSGRGIGRGIALGLAAYGVRVMVTDQNDEWGDRVQKEIEAAGGTAAYCHCDVCSPADIKQLVKYTAETFGDIDILVNNAGGGGLPLHFEEISDGLWEKIIHLNLTASFHTIREVFPYMKAKRSGKIVNISSGYGVTGGEYCAHYASAKAGLIGLTMSVAREVGEYHINCNCIATPTTDTPGLREADFEFVPEEIPFIPMGRIAMPEDIANCVLYLVSDAADYMTGQIVAPNGGRRMPI